MGNKNSVEELFISGNELFHATIFCKGKVNHIYAIKFQIWNFEIYFDVKDFLVVENQTMIKNLVQQQKILHEKNNIEMFAHLKKIVDYITTERFNEDKKWFDDYVYQLLMQIVTYIIKELMEPSA